MYGKIIINISAILFVAMCQIAFVAGLPDIFNRINIAVIVLVFILSFSNLRLALYWALLLGIVIDVYSFFVFGTYLLLFLIVTLCAYFLFINFFTNRSLYSLVALSILSSILFKLLLFFSSFLVYSFGLKDYFLQIDLQRELKTVVVESLLAVLFFYFFNYVNKNSRFEFLSRYKI
jgi:rod shape-determining protein MreD